MTWRIEDWLDEFRGALLTGRPAFQARFYPERARCLPRLTRRVVT
jgi:hypothetical protein